MKTTIHSITKTLSFGLILAMAGCSSYAQNSSDTLTDANIAAIVVGANKIDISAAELALQQSDNEKIHMFATRMIEDHNGVLQAAVDLVTRLGVTPVDNELVATLGNQAAEHEARLMQLSGAEFDRAYIDHEVEYHKAVIGVINDSLIPGATNVELKETLVSVVPAFEAHLAHSKKVAASL